MKKKLLAILLTLAISVSYGMSAFAEDTGTTTLPLTGIDVSSYQGVIDWSAVKGSGVQFAILRTGYGNEEPEKQTDAYFVANYEGATANGIKVGAYHYSYALTPETAVSEAQMCLNILGGRHLDYPVFFDLERPEHRTMTSEQITALVNAFCGTIANAGYQTGIYSNTSMYSGNLNCAALSSYDKWVAHFDTAAPNYNGTFAIWQYNSKGSVSGINGNVDMDYSFKDYPVAAQTVTKPVDTSLISDTASTLAMKRGKSYQFKFTPKNKSDVVKFSTGNSGVVKVVSQKKVGASYYVKVTALKSGSTSVYSTLTKQKAVSRCVVTVA